MSNNEIFARSWEVAKEVSVLNNVSKKDFFPVALRLEYIRRSAAENRKKKKRNFFNFFVW